MQKFKNLLLIFMAIIATNCQSPNQEVITNPEDYSAYLKLDENKSLIDENKNLEFWQKKLSQDSSQFPYIAKIAASQFRLFTQTAKIDYLKQSESNYLQVNELTNFNKVSYLQALARNYISQHRFKDALQLLKKAEINGENLKTTQLMLFDIYLELGNEKQAKLYLNKTKDLTNFDYLIRLSKWSDYKGDLVSAIKYMEKAVNKAEISKNKVLTEWAYTNIADFYGHNGQVKESYNYFLKSLKLNPNNAYAKKGIAWIAYSYDNNPNEALRILNQVTQTYNAPDYLLLKAEISEYVGDLVAKHNYIEDYLNQVSNKKYGIMYQSHNAMIYSQDVNNINKALQLAKNEVKQRPTTQSYDLLAWIMLKKGHVKEALKIANKHVVNSNFEPLARYHLAMIYQANNRNTEAQLIKKELEESLYELGPLMKKEINKL